MNEKVLVLGGSYFVGRKIVEYLYYNDYDVTVLNRGTREVPVCGVKQILCDRNNLSAMKEALKDEEFNSIIDVSWQGLDWVKYACEAINFDTVKEFVFISSSAVYDIDVLEIPFKEEDSLGENKYWTFYGKGKIDAEEYYINFLRNKKTNLSIIRPPYIYGEYNYAQRESLIFRQIMEGMPVAIPNTNPQLQFIYTEDLAAVILYLIRNNCEKLCIFNVGNEQAVTSRDWVIACSEVVGMEPRIIEVNYKKLGKEVRDFYPFFDYDNVLDVTKIKTLYHRETNFIEGLNRAFDWFQLNRENIVFKKNVDKTLYELIAELSI